MDGPASCAVSLLCEKLVTRLLGAWLTGPWAERVFGEGHGDACVRCRYLPGSMELVLIPTADRAEGSYGNGGL
jgi:hypothetical protein